MNVLEYLHLCHHVKIPDSFRVNRTISDSEGFYLNAVSHCSREGLSSQSLFDSSPIPNLLFCADMQKESVVRAWGGLINTKSENCVKTRKEERSILWVLQGLIFTHIFEDVGDQQI